MWCKQIVLPNGTTMKELSLFLWHYTTESGAAYSSGLHTAQVCTQLKSAAINQLHAPVTTFIFSCFGTQINYNPEAISGPIELDQSDCISFKYFRSCLFWPIISFNCFRFFWVRPIRSHLIQIFQVLFILTNHLIQIFQVLFNLANQLAANNMDNEAMNSYQMIVKNKTFSNAGSYSSLFV